MKILCVGKNYAAHAKEMGAQTPSEPVWFWKPESAIITDGAAIEVPDGIGAVHHEVEMALRIGVQARRTRSAADARRCIDAYTVAIDVTARDLQAQAKKEGRPWAQAKGFDTFLPLGAWRPLETVGLDGLPLGLSIDGTLRQEGTTGQMTWDGATLVHLASQWTTLAPGDIILTGTPAGVGPMVPGQRVQAWVGPARIEHPVTARLAG